jgi:hypothetical protein
MVEIGIGVLRSQSLDRRTATRERLVSEIDAWERPRNACRVPVITATDLRLRDRSSSNINTRNLGS